MHKGHKDIELIIENELANKMIGIAIATHKILGPGLLESAYQECLFHKIKQAGFKVEKEKVMPLHFEGVILDCGYRIDLLIENRLVIELKSVEKLNEIHLAEVLTYLKLGHFRLGLLINFNVALLRHSIKRIIN
jgi:GxxExxY protein